MNKIIHISKKVKNRAQDTLANVREKPYETRRQIVVFLTAFSMAILVVLWIALLKQQLGEKITESKNKPSATDLIRQDITRVYDSTKQVTDPLSQ
jgi:hypothetical protein